MGYFNVIQPCVVNGLHYVHPTKQPIEVADADAAELLAGGKLEPYPTSVDELATEAAATATEALAEAREKAEEPTTRRPRRPRAED